MEINKPTEVNNKPEEDTSLHNELIENYIKYKLSDKSKKTDFINNIMWLDEVNSSLIADLQRFWSKDRKFAWKINYESFNIYEFKKQIESFFISLNNRRKEFKAYILDTYDIDSDKYDSNILSKVKKISIDELESLLSDTTSIDDFLRRESLKLNRKDLRNFLKSFNYEDRIESIVDLNKKERLKQEMTFLMLELEGRGEHSPLFYDTLIKIINKLFFEISFDYSEKKELVEAFIPFITLQQAKDWKFINDDEILEYIENTILDWVEYENKWFLIDELKEDLSKIYIETSKIKIHDIDKLISSEWFSKIKDRIDLNSKIKQKEWPQNLDELILSMKEKYSEKLNSPENLIAWNKIIINFNDWNNSYTQYFDIYSTFDESTSKNTLSLEYKWGDWVYYTNKNSSLDHFSYKDFLDFLWKDQIKNISFVDNYTFQNKLSSWEISSDSDSFIYNERHDRDEDIKKLRKSFIEKLNSDKINTEIPDIDDSELDDKISNFSDEERIKYKNYIEQLNDLSNPNIFNLRLKLDGFDKDWIDYWLEPWTTFKTLKWEIYTIEDIVEDHYEWKISISRIWWWKEDLTFEDFFGQFKNKLCKRTAKVFSFDNFIDDINRKNNLWSGFKTENWEIHSEADKKDKKYNYNYLVSWDEGDCFFEDYNICKIHSISWNIATISLWKIVWETVWRNKNINYSMNWDNINISLGIMSTWVKFAWLKPKNIEKENIQEKLPEWTSDRKPSIWSKYVNNFYSVSAIIATWKWYVDFWENYIKDSEDEKVNRLLEKLPVLTKEQKAAYKISRENAEKKKMDDFLEKLKIKWSKDATEMVRDRLLDENSLQSQIEAALFFMAEKYGVLYEKEAMIPYKWKFLWYIALGWKIWDEIYMNRKKECKESWTHFTEEELVYDLIKSQCKYTNKPKRRSKLYKEYDAAMWTWRENEWKKWKDDSDKKNTFKNRLWFATSEAEDGWWVNSLGAMESILNKWNSWDIPSLNALPFILITSWTANSFTTKQADNFKDGILPTQFFVSKTSTVSCYNNCILQLSKDIERKFKDDPKYKGIWAAANELINGMQSRSEKDRVNAAKRFYLEQQWWAWWEIISRSLLMLNTRKTDKEAEFESWIFDNKDDNHIYSDYYDTFQSSLENSREARFKNRAVRDDGFKTDIPWTWWVTAWNTYETVKEFLKPASSWNGFYDKEFGDMYFNELIWQIQATRDNEYLEDFKKRQRISEILKPFMEWFSASYSPQAILSTLNNSIDTFYPIFKRWWVEKWDFEKWTTFLSWKKDHIISRYVDNIMNWNSWWSSKPDTNQSVFEILKWPNTN